MHWGYAGVAWLLRLGASSFWCVEFLGNRIVRMCIFGAYKIDGDVLDHDTTVQDHQGVLKTLCSTTASSTFYSYCLKCLIKVAVNSCLVFSLETRSL